MEFIKLINSTFGGYDCKETSNIPMIILGDFLASDVGCIRSNFKKWALDDNLGDEFGGNITGLERDSDYILLSDLYSEEGTSTELKMTRQQFVQVLTDWEEKVCKLKPKEVIIKYENDEFIFETKN